MARLGLAFVKVSITPTKCSPCNFIVSYSPHLAEQESLLSHHNYESSLIAGQNTILNSPEAVFLTSLEAVFLNSPRAEVTACDIVEYQG